MASKESIPSTLNVTKYHVKKTADGKDFLLGREVVTDRTAFTVCRVTKAEWDDATNKCTIFRLNDGTGTLGYANAFDTKEEMPKENTILKFYFVLALLADGPEPSCLSLRIEILHQPDDDKWHPQGKAWYDLLQQHWNECKDYYYKHCFRPLIDTIPQFDTPYDFLQLTPQQGCDVVKAIPLISGDASGHTTTEQQYSVEYSGLDVTNRLCRLVGYISQPSLCTRHVGCVSVNLMHSPMHISAKFHLNMASLSKPITPPPDGSTCHRIARLHIKPRQATESGPAVPNVDLTTSCFTILSLTKDAIIDAHNEAAENFQQFLDKLSCVVELLSSHFPIIPKTPALENYIQQERDLFNVACGRIFSYEKTIAGHEATIAGHEATIAGHEATIAQDKLFFAAYEQVTEKHEAKIAAYETKHGQSKAVCDLEQQRGGPPLQHKDEAYQPPPYTQSHEQSGQHQSVRTLEQKLVALQQENSKLKQKAEKRKQELVAKEQELVDTRNKLVSVVLEMASKK